MIHENRKNMSTDEITKFVKKWTLRERYRDKKIKAILLIQYDCLYLNDYDIILLTSWHRSGKSNYKETSNNFID